MAMVGNIRGPGGAALGVAGRQMRGQGDAAQGNCIAIMQDAIDLGGAQRELS
jgi:hypothetical protein